MVLLIIFHLFVLQQICLMLVAFSFFTTCTALLFLPCIARCNRCLPHWCSIIFFILGTFVCGAFLSAMWKEFQADTYSTLYDLTHIFTVLFTSGLLALFAYIKCVLTHHKVEGSLDTTTSYRWSGEIQALAWCSLDLILCLVWKNKYVTLCFISVLLADA